MFDLFVVWFIVWYGLLIFMKGNNWDHFLELRFLIVLGIALGIIWFIDLILPLFKNNKSKYVVIAIFAIGFLTHFIQADQWMLHEEYSSSPIENILELSQAVNKTQLDKYKDVIAVGTSLSHPWAMNYYTDQSFVYFDVQTIKKLLSQQKLAWAFEQFGVTRVIGYEPTLTQEIIAQTNITDIE
jgi:hypothetical protein